MYKIYYKEIEKVETLPNNVMEYLNEYKNQERYNQSINAWKLLFEKLNSDFNIKLENCEIKKTSNGKPFIDGIHFNISHSKNLVAIIISDAECGIDIQHIDSKTNHCLMAKKVLSSEELEIFNSISNENLKREYLAERFSVKEALYKADNSYFNYDKISVLNDANGKPYLKYINGHVSIAHDNDMVCAFVILVV